MGTLTDDQKDRSSLSMLPTSDQNVLGLRVLIFLLLCFCFRHRRISVNAMDAGMFLCSLLLELALRALLVVLVLVFMFGTLLLPLYSPLTSLFEAL